MIDEKALEDYVDQITAAKMLNVTQGRISQLCSGGRFEGATKIGWSWIIPRKAVLNHKRLPPGSKTKNPSPKEIKDMVASASNESNIE